ncbi:MAG: chorismate-binding protein [Aquiluna sp.]|nr:chorismate-binding protein [Aquiluna sp.]
MLSLSEFLSQSKSFNVIPVVKRLFSGTETPIGIYQKLAGKNPDTFLLESAEQGVWGRYSFIGVESRGQLTATGSQARWQGQSDALPGGSTLSAEPMLALEQVQTAWKSAPVDFPLSSGLVGFLSWGAVNLIETLPDSKPADYEIPLYGFNQFSQLVVMDHQTSEIVLVSVVFIDGQDLEAAHKRALSEVSELERRLSEPTPAILTTPDWPEPETNGNTTEEEFLQKVELAKEHVRAGDVFQVVISQRFDHDLQADALEVYRALRAMNPSPYMYLTRWKDDAGEFAIVGSSPEALIKITGDQIVTHPIAGSRPRGADLELDNLHAQELLGDQKEISEHLMLVDLARNDLLKVCDPTSLRVSEFMQIHRFSHIMHLVSTVEGRLLPTTNMVSAMLATFPAGTLSGAPKPRALEIIHDLEPSYRGLFGGLVGYFDFQGNADLAIAIRTAVLRDGVARIQAGAGIVLDSVAKTEYEETKSKASVVLRAVAAANAMAHE